MAITLSAVLNGDQPYSPAIGQPLSALAPIEGAGQTTAAADLDFLGYDVPSDAQVVALKAVIRARSGANAAAYVILGGFKNNTGTVSKIGATAVALTVEDGGIAAAAVDWVISGTKVGVRCTGIAATTIDWYVGITHA